MVKKAENIIVGISIGDLNGIGSEVILKTFEDIRMLELCTPVIFANVKIISFLKKELKLDLAIHGIDKIEQLVVGKINVLNVWREGVNLEFGKNDDVVGSYAIKSFVAATKALKEGLVDVLVTAPINKYNIQSEEFKFPGHTDFLDKELEGDALMLMVHDDLRVGLLTDHVPVNEVAKHLNEKLLTSKIKTIIKTLKSIGFIIESLTGDDVESKYMGIFKFKEIIGRIDIRFIPSESFSSFQSGSPLINISDSAASVAIFIMMYTQLTSNKSAN